MRTKLPANVTRERNRHGTVVYYHRVGKGKRTRLPDFGTDEFEDAYQAARQGKPLPKRRSVPGAEGTLAWLVTEYKKTAHFRGLDEITQRRRDSFYRQMVEKSGNELIADIEEQHVVDGVEERAMLLEEVLPITWIAEGDLRYPTPRDDAPTPPSLP